jgi:hypothetical protein
MTLTPTVDVTVLGPDEPAGARRINLFLYKVEENTFLKNREWTTEPGIPNRLVPPPLSLNLFYLMTPYAPNDALTGNVAAHQLLGEAMRVFYENAVVPKAYLDAGLKDAREQLQLVNYTLDPEELSRVWNTFAQPFRLSVLYEVSTVQLDVLPKQQRPMAPRVRRVGIPGVRQPLDPPAVLAMSPDHGAVGTSVTFTGVNLSGWRATVAVGDRTALQGQALASDSFTAAVPPGLLPGFYDVGVDISRMFRRNFLFEVTP